MMNRVVIEVGTHNEDDNKIVTLRVEEPLELADLGSSALDLSSEDPVFAALEALAGDEPVRGAGELIYQRITQNAAVHEALGKIAGIAPGEALELVFRVSPANPADDLPWEALYLPDENLFVGLDARSPMARMAGHAGPESEFVPLSGPVRIVAVLAALERNALPEWQAIYEAAANSGLDFEIALLCSEQALKEVVEAAADARVTVELVPNDPERLVRAISKAQPHLLHVFSHAKAEGGFLEIATPQAVGLGDAAALVYLDARSLAEASSKTWLTVLNACEGAQPTANGRSLAFAITNDGTPASIGMRHEIDATDAHEFTAAFYAEALDHISHSLADGGPTELHWAEVVRMARNRMLPYGPKDEIARANKEWTLPVLYLRSGRYVLWKTTPAAALDPGRARELAAQLRELESTVIPDDASNEFRTLVEGRIAELRAQLGG